MGLPERPKAHSTLREWFHMSTEAISRLAGQYGGLKRHNHQSAALVVKRDLAAERIAAYAAKIVADAPPLTDAQRDRIALVLKGGE